MRNFISDFSRARSARDKSKPATTHNIEKKYKWETTTNQQKTDNNDPTKETRQPITKRNTPTNQQMKHNNQ